jgi:hypothetical protein
MLESLLPMLASATSGQTQNIITLLENIVPVIVKEASDLVAPVQNIIAQLQTGAQVTPAQIAALQAQSDALDAALDAAAADDKLV